MTNCPVCEGHGEVPCRVCQQTFVAAGEDRESRSVICTRCGGTGIAVCPYCNGCGSLDTQE